MGKGGFLVLVFVCGSLGCGNGTRAINRGTGGTGWIPDAAAAGNANDSGAAGGGRVRMDAAVAGVETGPLATGGFPGAGGIRIDAAATADTATGGIRIDAAERADAAIADAGAGGARTDAAGKADVRTGGVATGGSRAGGNGSGGSMTGGAPGASLTLNASRFDFGSVPLGTASVATFTLTNRGDAPSGIPVLSTDAPTSVGIAGCGQSLGPQASCLLTVTVSPPKLGLFQAFARISATPGTQGPNASYLSIYVVGRAVGFESSSPTRFDLGDLAPGDARTFQIPLTALIPLSDLKVGTSGPDLAIDASATTCAAALALDATCVVTVVFQATELGWKEASLGIRAGGDLGQFIAVVFTANITKASDLAIVPQAPPTIAAVYEQPSDPIVFTVTNQGATSTGPITAAIVGRSAQDFRIRDTDCATLAPGGSCTLAVICHPPMSASADIREAILSVTDGNTHLAVPLSATVTFH